MASLFADPLRQNNRIEHARATAHPAVAHIDVGLQHPAQVRCSGAPLIRCRWQAGQRELFRPEAEHEAWPIIEEVIVAAAGRCRAIWSPLCATGMGRQRLAGRYAQAAWELLLAWGRSPPRQPAQALGVTAQTASQVASILEIARLVTIRDGDAALLVKMATAQELGKLCGL
jgi:hypothetical protein